jgi:hypothetical protein
MRRSVYILAILAGIGGLFWLVQRPTIAHTPAGPGDNCKGTPEFIGKYGMRQPEFDTSRRNQPGLVLSDGADPNREVIQLDTWRQFGSLSSISRDEKGAVYTANVPFINTLTSSKEDHLAIFRLDPKTGKLERWLTLAGNAANSQNYYGITALTYDCATHLLYVSSVAGSSKDKEDGFIAVVDPATKTEKFRYYGIDALGLGVFGGTKGRHLYIGSARESTIVRLGLTGKGEPFGKPEQVLNFDSFNRTRARKIVFTSNTMDIFTTEFYFNLVASTEFDQQHLQYQYDTANDIFRRTSANR